jgi:hypothetical protein
MARLPLTLLALSICGCAVAGFAQDQEPNYNTGDNALLIKNWLHSDDPRLVAFGARFASESDDEGEITALLGMVERWNPAQRSPVPDEDHLLAMSEVLHALIQRKAEVPPAALSTVALYFPDQAAILASRLPLEDATPLLEGWYESGENVDRKRSGREVAARLLLARVAAMMLSKAPPQSLVASLLSQSEELLTVSVPSQGFRAVNRASADSNAFSACGEEVVNPPKADWPPLWRYVLEENAPGGDDGAVIAEAGGDAITYRRIPENVRIGYCYAPLPLDSERRHRLLAEMLGENEKEMLWQPRKQIPIPWKSGEQVKQDLSRVVGTEEGALRATVSEFYTKGLLTRSQLDTIRPKLYVFVFDDRQKIETPNLPLPQLAFQDSRTFFRVTP